MSNLHYEAVLLVGYRKDCLSQTYSGAGIIRHGMDLLSSASRMQALRQCVDGVFPTAAGSMTKAAACMFTNTPDTRFIIDFHPQHEEVQCVLRSA